LFALRIVLRTWDIRAVLTALLTSGLAVLVAAPFISDGPALRRVINGPRIMALTARLFGEPSAHFGFAWLRAMPAGRASPLHVDHPYMNRGSHRLVTVWTPLGHVARDEGPLYVVENSHRDPDIRTRFEGHDVDRDPSRRNKVACEGHSRPDQGNQEGQRKPDRCDARKRQRRLPVDPW
jgi:hypothetical protein